MARPLKTGLDYFPLDVSFFDDTKMLFLSDKYGEKGELIAIKLLCWIYKNGFGIEWNDEVALIFAKRNFVSIKASLCQDVVNELLKRGFFNKSIFDKSGFLTSSGIQKRWVESTKKRKRTHCIPLELRAFIPDEKEETTLTQEETTLKKEETPSKKKESTQSKVKESKVKKKRGGENKNSPPAQTDIIQHFKSHNGKIQSAIKFYNHFKALNWKNSIGAKIENWQAKADNWILEDLEKEKEKNKNEPKHPEKDWEPPEFN